MASTKKKSTALMDFFFVLGAKIVCLAFLLRRKIVISC